jgi:hypothetical protein
MAGERIFLFSRTFKLAVAPTQPPISWVLRELPRDKAARHDVDHSHIMNEWSCTYTHPVCLCGMHRAALPFCNVSS